MLKIKKLRLRVCPWLVLIPIAGCGSSGGLEKVVVSGTVRFQGSPVEKGEIRFAPIKGTKGPASIAFIHGGEYRIEGRGGVPVGTHRVEIQSYRKIPNAKPYSEEEADGQWNIKAGDIPEEQFIPERYNRKSTLEISIEPGNREVVKEFDLS